MLSREKNSSSSNTSSPAARAVWMSETSSESLEVSGRSSKRMRDFWLRVARRTKRAWGEFFCFLKSFFFGLSFFFVSLLSLLEKKTKLQRKKVKKMKKLTAPRTNVK
jgi:hypothetical protein